MLVDMQGQIDSIRAGVDHFSAQTDSFNHTELKKWFTNEILITGCGATYALAMTTASLYRKKGFRSTAIPASEIFFYPGTIPQGTTTLIAFSRSGETSETLKAVERFRECIPQGKVIAITANIRSALAKTSDLLLDCSIASEVSIIETKTFSVMLILAQLLITWLQKHNNGIEVLRPISNNLESDLGKVIKVAERITKNEELNRFIFLGSGPLFGIAYQASLTLKECFAGWSEAFHPLEFRHGPRTTATKGALICLYASDNDQIAEQEKLVLTEMKDQGAYTLIFSVKNHIFDKF